MIETWQLSKEHQAKASASPTAKASASPGEWTSPVPLDDNLTNVKLVLLHEQIAQIYRWWADEAPGVTPQETGHLADLWAHVDQLEESQ